MSDQYAPGAAAAPSGPGSTRGFRPTAVAAVPLAAIGESIGVVVPGASGAVSVTGISLNSRAVQPGDLYVALPGASRHGADFVAQAVEAGAAAVLTDDAGARLLALLPRHRRAGAAGRGTPQPRRRTVRPDLPEQPDDATAPALYGVTGTNGKTTTTYFINCPAAGALGRRRD